MPPPIGTVWEHFEILSESNNKKHVRCCYCPVQYKHAWAYRLKKHLINCYKCPDDVKNIYQEDNAPTETNSSIQATPRLSTTEPISEPATELSTEPSALEPTILMTLLTSSSMLDSVYKTTPTTKSVPNSTGDHRSDSYSTVSTKRKITSDYEDDCDQQCVSDATEGSSTDDEDDDEEDDYSSMASDDSEQLGVSESPSSCSWKPFICRCCLNERGVYDVTKTYKYPKDERVFLNMLTECGITLSRLSTRSQRLICATCAISLQHAHNFKKQVWRAEVTFIEFMNNATKKAKNNVKAETSSNNIKNKSTKHKKGLKNKPKTVKHLKIDKKTDNSKNNTKSAKKRDIGESSNVKLENNEIMQMIRKKVKMFMNDRERKNSEKLLRNAGSRRKTDEMIRKNVKINDSLRRKNDKTKEKATVELGNVRDEDEENSSQSLEGSEQIMYVIEDSEPVKEEMEVDKGQSETGKWVKYNLQDFITARQQTDELEDSQRNFTDAEQASDSNSARNPLFSDSE